MRKLKLKSVSNTNYFKKSNCVFKSKYTYK